MRCLVEFLEVYLMTRVNVYIWQRPMKDKLNTMVADYDEVELKDFVMVYYTKKMVDFKKINDMLDALYVQLSNDYPDDYHARSLGASDLIMIRDPESGKVINYIVDLVGFKEVKVNIS